MTKEKDWFIKQPFLVPVGTKITYYSGDKYGHTYEFYNMVEFMSDTYKNVILQETIEGDIPGGATSPAAYLSQGFDSVTFELPSEFTVGKTVYEVSTGKKLEVAPEQSSNKSDEYIYCNIPDEKGVYLIDVEELSFEKPAPKIQGLTFDQIWFEEADELEYFPSSDTSEYDQSIDEASNWHASMYQPNSQGGIKFDSKKARPTLLLKSMPQSVQEVIDVLELGARKYAPDNWKKVENERYHDAMLRHVLSYLAGEINDPETSKHHLAHAVCNMLFLIEKENTVAQRNQD